MSSCLMKPETDPSLRDIDLFRVISGLNLNDSKQFRERSINTSPGWKLKIKDSSCDL